MNPGTVKCAQWDKTQSREVLIKVCLWLCTISVHSTAQNSSDNLPSYLQTIIIAQMLCIGGQGSYSYYKLQLRWSLLSIMKIDTYRMCPKCNEEEETAYHFLGKCNAMMMAHHSVFGAYLMEANELQQVQLHTVLRFARASKRFI